MQRARDKSDNRPIEHDAMMPRKVRRSNEGEDEKKTCDVKLQAKLDSTPPRYDSDGDGGAVDIFFFLSRRMATTNQSVCCHPLAFLPYVTAREAIISRDTRLMS